VKFAAKPLIKVFRQSFYAECYIGFSGMLSMVVAGGLADAASLNPTVQAFVFAALFQVNLRIILLTGSILFTEPRPPSCRDLRAQNPLDQHPQDLRCLLDGDPARRRDLRAAHRVLRYDRGLTAQLAKKVAEKRIAKTFLITTIKGIGCNWMVCMAVFLCEQAQDMAGHQDFRNQQVHHEEHVCT